MQLSLYYRPFCGYCQKVLKFMETNNISVTLRDISGDPQAHQELMSIGGKNQVPCLVIDGNALYESDDIIRWLGENK